MHEILDIIHKTIYQFFDVCGDNEEVPMSDKDKLLLEVNKTICNNLKALKQEPCGDAISRQAVLDKAYAYGNGLEPEGYCVDVDDIQALPPVTPQPKQIPVGEGLPKKEGLYLVSVKNEHERRYSKTCWFTKYQNWFARQDVVAWMSLPAPFEPQKDD